MNRLGILMVLLFAGSLAADPLPGDSRGLQIILPGNAQPEGLVALLSPLDGQDLPEIPKTSRLTLCPDGFDRPLVCVQVPTRLVICNTTERVHNIYCMNPGQEFDLGMMGHDAVGKSIPIETSGRLDLHCSIQDISSSTVLAISKTVARIVGQDTQVDLSGLAPGKWLLRTWQRDPRRPDLDTTLTLPLSAPLRLTMPE